VTQVTTLKDSVYILLYMHCIWCLWVRSCAISQFSHAWYAFCL